MTEHLNPGETEAEALKRQIKMHEFLMSGGVQIGYKEGRMAYSGPVSPSTHPVCPWHGEGCVPWAEISEGRGEWTRIEAELAEVESYIAAATSAEELEALNGAAETLREQLSYRPRDAKKLRERTDAEFEAEKALYKKPGVYAAAGPKTGGNPWDKPSHTHHTVKHYVPAPVLDARDDAVIAVLGLRQETPDSIEIDDEGEEGTE